MKHVLLALVMLSLSAQAQEVVFDTTYYAPPPVVRKRALTADPDQNDRRSKDGRSANSQREQLNRFRDTQTWYVSLEGGFRSDVSSLNNSLDQLVTNPRQTKATWSVLTGYTFRNAWSIETGYTQSPIHLGITIINGGANPLVYNYQNNGYGIPLRLRRRIGLGKRAANGTGFWLTGGIWLVPNGDGQTGSFRLIGYRYHNRTRTDTLRLNNITTITKRITGIAELGIDYSVRLSSTLELGLYARNYWGLGQALQSDLVYTINNSSTQQATITADGAGWGFGIALRYVYGRQQELKTP